MGEDADALPGFFEAANEFERVAKVKMMDDATLLHSHRALSNNRAVQNSQWLELIEREVRARGLSATN